MLERMDRFGRQEFDVRLREAQIPYDASVMSGGVTRDVTVVEMNELVIRKNLAEATRQTLEGLGRP